jgi:hypothetical protein
LEDIDIGDRQAFYEWERRTANISLAVGFVDLTEVTEINRVDNYQDVPTDSHRTEFELIFIGGRRIIFKTNSAVTRDFWVEKLNDLWKYWRKRQVEDVQRARETRAINLERLHIDEDVEAAVGESAAKWESDRAIADAYIYSIRSISLSRSILMKGELFQKPIKHSSFRKCYALLTHGHLHIYSPFTRSFSGALKPRVNYHRIRTIDLKDCYVISGPITADDLLARDVSFDIEDPGSHSLPRVYPDGWKSAEEEIFRCFVLWYGLKKPIHTVDSTGKKVLATGRRLGTRGVSIVFLARSREERDHWVTNLNQVISAVSPTYDESIDVE